MSKKLIIFMLLCMIAAGCAPTSAETRRECAKQAKRDAPDSRVVVTATRGNTDPYRECQVAVFLGYEQNHVIVTYKCEFDKHDKVRCAP